MKVVADLQIHSKYARAVSPQMNVPTISSWAGKKGIDLVATGDWTHPLWFRELGVNLKEVAPGLYSFKGETNAAFRSLFFLSTEVSSIYKQGGRLRRIHNLVFAPNLEVVGKINKELLAHGANLFSDGRPIVGLSSRAVTEIVLGIDNKCMVIPAHAWTPHFGLFGQLSGFDSLEECFGDLSKYIYAIETGLSSDPAMNWRIEELCQRQIVSFSDAHSPTKLGREATVFDLSELSYGAIRRAIMGDGKEKIAYTIEFYPEEGKYHFTGHRNCKIVYSPNEARKAGPVCPVCGGTLTTGVMSRVEHLAKLEAKVETVVDKLGVRWIKDPEGKRPSYVMLVPLLEILAEACSSGVSSKKVVSVYDNLITSLGSEFNILLSVPTAEIAKVAGPKVAEAVGKVRCGDIVIEPGFDGVFGRVNIWRGEERPLLNQQSLF